MLWGHIACPCCPEVQAKPGARNHRTLGHCNGRSKQTGQERAGEGHLIQQYTPGMAQSHLSHMRFPLWALGMLNFRVCAPLFWSRTYLSEQLPEIPWKHIANSFFSAPSVLPWRNICRSLWREDSKQFPCCSTTKEVCSHPCVFRAWHGFSVLVLLPPC